jgi:hypothetical protein
MASPLLARIEGRAGPTNCYQVSMLEDTRANGNLPYNQAFVKHGVSLFVGTDDPGFTSADLKVEVAAVCAAVQARL